MRASSVLLDHSAAGTSPERYTHIFISSIDRIGLRQGDLGSNCEAFLFYQRKRAIEIVRPRATSGGQDAALPPSGRHRRDDTDRVGIAICLDRRAIRAAARAERKLRPRLLAARAERLDLDRRGLGVGRSQRTAVGGG